MTFKLRQFIHRANAVQTVYPNTRRSNLFLLNQIRHTRLQRTSGAVRASMGFLQWLLHRHADRRIAYRSACFLTGRRRGMIRRFAVSRTRVKQLSEQGLLFGVRKSSW